MSRTASSRRSIPRPGKALFGSWLTTQTFTDLFHGSDADGRRFAIYEATLSRQSGKSSHIVFSGQIYAFQRRAARGGPDRDRARPRHLQLLQARARHGAGRVRGRSGFREEVRGLCDRGRGGADAARQRGPPHLPRTAPRRQGARLCRPRGRARRRDRQEPVRGRLDVPQPARAGARPHDVRRSPRLAGDLRSVKAALD